MLSAARPRCDAVQIRATNASPDPVSMVRKRMALVCSQYASVPKKRSSSRRLNNFRGAYASQIHEGATRPDGVMWCKQALSRTTGGAAIPHQRQSDNF
jgi:hypothetical protein